MRLIKTLVVHCSATPPGRDIGRAEIDRWHRDKGWAGIGYHYVIRLNGTVEKGRQDRVAGAHVANHNALSIGICVVGGVGTDGRARDTVTAQQAVALEQLLVRLRSEYPGTRICGHRDLSPDRNRDGVVTRDEWLKECPSFDVAAWCRARGINPEASA
jgi:N-acetyl-anhydromuramyl-L-alanine amidase AmpD